MYEYGHEYKELRTCNQAVESGGRYINAQDIIVPFGYKIEIFAAGLNFPVNMVFTENGDILIAESGYMTGVSRILRLSNGVFDIIAENFNEPLSGINYRNGKIYASHRGFVTELSLDGSRKDIISGLPSNGDFVNNKVEFGPDNKVYFGQGAATNSGVVGKDNQWVLESPLLCDYPGMYIMLKGQNFETKNMLMAEGVNETALTGAFSPYGVPNIPYEIRKGLTRATGGILRANLDGSELELYAWGLRNAVRLKFDEAERLFAASHGYDERGSRPIANSSDQIYLITQGQWYGWPDFTAGEPVTIPRFTPEGHKPVEFLLASHPSIPPLPFAKFPPNSTIMGFDINYNSDFGNVNDMYIAEFGSVWPNFMRFIIPNPGIGHKISRVDVFTGGTTTFAINKSGFPASITQEGGFGWPTDVVFGPDHAMYVVDFGSNVRNNIQEFMPHTGAIWRISRQ